MMHRGVFRSAAHGRPLAWQASIVCLLLAAAWAPARAEDAPERLPKPLTHYLGREIAPYMTFHGADWLMRPERSREEHTEQVLEALNLKPGQVVCDIGCGNGYYTLPMAQRVGPTGRVLAVDIQQEMLHLLDLRLKEAKIENVEPILGTPIDPKLPAGQVDVILLVDVYHEFSYPKQMLAAMRRSLKPDGRLVLVEFRAEDPTVPIKPLHKMTRKQALKELRRNGYRLADEFDGLSWQHMLFFARDPKPGEKTEDSAAPEEDEATLRRQTRSPGKDS